MFTDFLKQCANKGLCVQWMLVLQHQVVWLLHSWVDLPHCSTCRGQSVGKKTAIVPWSLDPLTQLIYLFPLQTWTNLLQKISLILLQRPRWWLWKASRKWWLRAALGWHLVWTGETPGWCAQTSCHTVLLGSVPTFSIALCLNCALTDTKTPVLYGL